MRAVGEVPMAVSVAAFKRAVHIIEGVTDDDALIDDLLRAAQDTVETATRRPMSVRTVVIEYRGAGWRRWWFPVAPVVSVQAVSVQQEDGSFLPLPSTDWRLEMAADEPCLVFAEGIEPQGALVRVECTVGHAEGTAPRQLAQAVVLLAKEWMDAGIAIEAGQAGAGAPMGFGVRSLMRQVRYVRPAELAIA